jgi:hypothetical protein
MKFLLVAALLFTAEVPTSVSASGSQANLASNCDSTETFVFVPPGVNKCLNRTERKREARDD